MSVFRVTQPRPERDAEGREICHRCGGYKTSVVAPAARPVAQPALAPPPDGYALALARIANSALSDAERDQLGGYADAVERVRKEIR